MQTDATSRHIEADLKLTRLRDRFSTERREIVESFNKDLEKVRAERSEKISSMRTKIDKDINSLKIDADARLNEEDIRFRKKIDDIRKIRDQKLRSVDAEQLEEMQRIRVELQNEEREMRRQYLAARSADR